MSTTKKGTSLIEDAVTITIKVPRVMVDKIDDVCRLKIAPRTFIVREALAEYLRKEKM